MSIHLNPAIDGASISQLLLSAGWQSRDGIAWRRPGRRYGTDAVLDVGARGEVLRVHGRCVFSPAGVPCVLDHAMVERKLALPDQASRTCSIEE